MLGDFSKKPNDSANRNWMGGKAAKHCYAARQLLAA